MQSVSCERKNAYDDQFKDGRTIMVMAKMNEDQLQPEALIVGKNTGWKNWGSL